MTEKFCYRPELDGLRALAVSAVVLFHAGFGCRGGYVGVDIFFVISGYLITTLIWKDLEKGTFTFGQFWERRARRIVPALVVVTLATMLAGWFLLLPDDYRSLGKAAASQVVFAANFNYWLESGYFEGAAEEKPLLHTWSLAVEEQFYLIMPWILAGLFALIGKRSSGRSRKSVTAICLAVGLLFSLAVSIYGLSYDPNATFYLLPSRAWELLCGSLIAFFPSPSEKLGRLFRDVVSLCGLLLVAVPIFVYDSETAFPGLAAVPPCLGAALLIWIDGSANRFGLTISGTILSLRPVVFVGLISYSLYLWHWPFIAFAKYCLLAPPNLALRLSLLGAGAIMAVLSWKYVETPFREKRLVSTRSSIFVFACGGMASVVALGAFCLIFNGFPQRFPERTLAFADAKTDMAFFNNLSVEDLRSGRLVSIGSPTTQHTPDVLVWGDSHAMAALPAVDALLNERGLSGRAATHSSTLPVCDWFVPTKYGLKEESLTYNAEVLEYIKREQIKDVLLIAYWRGYGLNDASREKQFETALLATIEKLVEQDSRAWVLLDVPVHGFDIPKALSRSGLSPADLSQFCSKPATLSEDGPNKPELRRQIEECGGRVLDPKPMFVDDSSSSYVIQANDIALYRDGHHLTTQGAKLLLLPFLREAMQDIGRE